MITQPQTTPAAPTAPDPDEERLRVQTARLVSYRDDGPLVRPAARPARPRPSPGPRPRCSRSLAVAALAVTDTLAAGPDPARAAR